MNSPTIPTLIKRKTLRLMMEGESVKCNFTIRCNEDKVKEAEEDAKPWFDPNKHALLLIVDAIPANKLYLIQNTKTTKEAWEAL